MAITRIKGSNIEDGTIADADIAAVAASKLTGTVADARFPATLPVASGANLTALPAANLTGSIADARVPASAVTQHVAAVDLSAVRQDIAMLALYNAVSDNRAAYNLPFSFIDQFEDDTGTTTRTNVSNADEYFATVYSVTGQFTSDANTKLLMHMDDSGLTTDSGNTGHTITNTSAVRSSAQSKFGGYSAYFNGSSSLTAPNHADWSFGTGDFTIEFWFRSSNVSANAGYFDLNKYSTQVPVINQASGSLNVQCTGLSPGTTSISNDTWYHVAFGRDSGTARAYKNGTQFDSGSWTASQSSSSGIMIGGYYSSSYHFTGYIDELRVSNVARYPSGTAFTPNVTASTNATGTLISDTQTASSATTKMSGVILYKDNAGTATLGTDLVISLSANGGTNWTEAASYGTVTPLFSTGVKMVRLGETTVTSGTAPVIKAVWANQASGSKETQLHGWAMNY